MILKDIEATEFFKCLLVGVDRRVKDEALVWGIH